MVMTRRHLPLPRRSRRRTNTTRLLGHTAFVAGNATSARICAKQAAHVVMHRKPAHTHTPTSAQRTSGATRGPTTNACARNTQRTYYHSDCKEPTHTGTLLRSEWCGAERCAAEGSTAVPSSDFGSVNHHHHQQPSWPEFAKQTCGWRHPVGSPRRSASGSRRCAGSCAHTHRGRQGGTGKGPASPEPPA